MSQILQLPVMAAKENKPNLQDADRKALIENHAKPINLHGPPASVVAPCLKRFGTAPSSVNVPPSKITKAMKKTARFNKLLGEHKNMKGDFEDLKEKHVEMSDNYEKTKSSVQNIVNERDQLKDNLLKTLTELQERVTEFDKLKVDYDIIKLVNENLQRKSVLLDELTSSLRVLN